MSASLATGAPARGLPRPAAIGELLKPITWFAAMWAFGCGVISAGRPAAGHWPQIWLGVALAGPLVCGTSQAVNDWFDRHVDAVNEPGRPIPSGRIPGRWGLYIAIIWSLLSALVAAYLGTICFMAACVGLPRLTGGCDGSGIPPAGPVVVPAAARAVTTAIAGPAAVGMSEANWRDGAEGCAYLLDGALDGEDDTEPSAVEPLP